MHRNKFYVWGLLVLILALALGACAEQGEDLTATPVGGVVTETAEPSPVETEPAATETEVTEAPAETATPTQDTGEMETPDSVRAQDLLDAEVHIGSEAEASAEVEDLLMDANGNIRWVILTDLETDETLATSIESYRYEQREEMSRLTAETDPRAEAETIDLDAAFGDDAFLDEDAEVPASFSGEQLIRMSGYTDFDLQNDAGEDLGEVEGLIIDLQSMQVTYAIADVGGFLGIGENTVLIPWERLELQQADDEEQPQFVLPGVDQERLENAPTVDLDAIDLSQENWDEEYQSFWTNGS